MNIVKLKTEFPDWQWRAERSGWGWRYKGAKNDKTIVIYSCSILTGVLEDDYSTKWFVDDGIHQDSYVAWWMKQKFEHKNRKE